MRRSLGFVPFLALSALLAACQEEGGELTSAPAAASASTIEAACAEAPEICELIEGLFPAPKPGKGLESAAYTRFGNIARQRDQGEIADAVAKTFELIVFVFEKDLDDPNGGAPPTTDEGRIQLANLLLEFVGLPATFPVGQEDFAWQICKPGVKCVFQTESQFAGFSGTFTELTLVTIVLRASTSGVWVPRRRTSSSSKRRIPSPPVTSISSSIRERKVRTPPRTISTRPGRRRSPSSVRAPGFRPSPTS